MKPGERVQLLRQLAEHLQNENWPDIDLTLREFGFETLDTWSGDRYTYVLELLSRGRSEDLLGLHEFLFGFSGEADTTTDAPDLWEAGRFRLFLSHVNAQKVFCSTLKEALHSYGIAAFVAHEDIEPTREWVDEIERAMGSCDALAAVLHEGFHESNWTDQEVGFCHARRLLIVPIRLDLDPYGFVSRYQAVNGRGKTAEEIANELWRILIAHPKTSALMAEATVTNFEYSRSYADAKRNVLLLKEVQAWTPTLLRRLEEAPDTNGQIRDAFGVPGQVRMILRDHGIDEAPPSATDEYPLPF